MKINDIINEMSAGSVATVAMPMGKMIKRPNPSVFPKKKKVKEVSQELEENKIFFVKVGDGRDHMVVKVKADTKGAAVKKMKAQYPKQPVSLDRNSEQGKPAGALESLEEGEERSIIQDAVVDHLIDTFGGQNWMIFADTREQLEAKMYDEIETLDVDEVVDSSIEVGGQPIGNFASGRVLDVIDSSSAIESAMQHVEGLDEGKSPHKKGSAKYKKHMAAMHAEDVNDSGMIGKPDSYYDEEERKEAYNELQDALDQCRGVEADYVKDGICPECAGSSYIDGDYEEEEDSCDGWGNYGCDEGEMSYMNDTVSWKQIMDHDKKQAEKTNRGPAPDKETIMKVLPRLHDDYVKSGRFNAMELPSILRQMYPELGKREAASYTSEFFKTFKESLDENYNPRLITMLSQFEQDCEEKGYYGDTDVITIDQLIKAGKTEEAAEEMAGAMSDQDGGSDKFDHIYDMALDAVEDYMHEPAMAEMRKLAGI